MANWNPEKITQQTHPKIVALAKAAFPDYRGRKFRLVVDADPIDVRSYWDGGSRDYFRFVNLATAAMAEVPAQSAFDKPINGAERVELPPHVACVRHSYFCGKDSGLTVFLPKPATVTEPAALP